MITIFETYTYETVFILAGGTIYAFYGQSGQISILKGDTVG
jgi:hypothetical protein